MALPVSIPITAGQYLAVFMIGVVLFAVAITRLSLRDERHTPKALRTDDESEQT